MDDANVLKPKIINPEKSLEASEINEEIYNTIIKIRLAYDVEYTMLLNDGIDVDEVNTLKTIRDKLQDVSDMLMRQGKYKG
ncbi:MAG: hypothetical protein KC684_07070 [Candidatus Omnitrophica bacterium]|nr:hypothetical protein [Candidatus Omnitrophota bacterium]